MMTSRKVAGANYVCGVVAFDRLLIFIQRRTSTLLIALSEHFSALKELIVKQLIMVTCSLVQIKALVSKF